MGTIAKSVSARLLTQKATKELVSASGMTREPWYRANTSTDPKIKRLNQGGQRPHILCVMYSTVMLPIAFHYLQTDNVNQSYSFELCSQITELKLSSTSHFSFDHMTLICPARSTTKQGFFDNFLSAVEPKGKTNGKQTAWDGAPLTWRCAVLVSIGSNLHIIRVVAVNVKILQEPATLPLLTVFSREAGHAITCKTQ